MKRVNDEFLLTILRKAEELQLQAQELPQTNFLKRLKPLLSNQENKFFLIRMLDTALRPKKNEAVSKYVLKLLTLFPNHKTLFNSLEKVLVSLFSSVGHYFPGISIPLMKNRIKSITETVVFPLGGKSFNVISKKRKENQVKQNINLIGEALLGEDEAALRIKAYKKLIQDPSVNYISIKISTIYSQISSLAYTETLSVLKEKLAELYSEAQIVEKSSGKTTFINLDMEEYRDLSLTVDLFESTLSDFRFKNLCAGIVLQAYMPDSFHYLKRLQSWAKIRVEQGGAPIKIRIVKGANMEMEKLEASIKGWELAPHNTKLDTDAQYKRMLVEMLTIDSCKAIRLGIASHNVFDLAFALLLTQRENLHAYVDIEMLEGLAENLIQPLQQQGVSVLLYTPVVYENQFLSAIAYLVRRFDEATAEGNFLRESAGMKVNDAKWSQLQQAFINSYLHMEKVNLAVRRTQNRITDHHYVKSIFENSADTDWTLSQNLAWVSKIKLRWTNDASPLPRVFPEYDTTHDRELLQMVNWNGALPWKFRLACLIDYKNAIEKSKNSLWNTMDYNQRITILRQAAVELEKHRGDLIGVGVSEVGKLITEMDSEVSEAVDFANYYAASIEELLHTEGLSISPQGINLVLSPWNFPVAIPAGGILASLAAGNTVIIKPAKRSIACAYVLVNALWQAGIPKDALHFLPANSSEIESLLTENSPFASVILTGGTDTAKQLLHKNLKLNLYAETGGKNATIVTSFADKDMAVKNIVDSAFSNTGQKCSATSLLILEKEVYEDAHFMELLRDTVQSKKVGSPWDLDSKIGPLANPLHGKLETEINAKRQWLVKSETAGKFMVSPAVVLGIQKDDFCFQNELFGPHLSVVKAENLDDAIHKANSVAFGLTSGLESLNEDEIERWKETIQAGNLYINRGTTGAIVKRQPFGGLKLSSFGPGMKAGGKNYVTQFLNVALMSQPHDPLSYAKQSYQFWNDQLFSKVIDEVNIRGQENSTRYLKPDKVLVMVCDETPKEDLVLVDLACSVLGIPMHLISTEKLSWLDSEECSVLENWIDLLPKIQWNTRLRNLCKSELPSDFHYALIERGIHLYSNKPMAHGRIELLNYLQEQSISHNYHRYGNLMGYTPNITPQQPS